MNFRPRYSLLTLLVLTAIVAGGVKLWRGPYHVVEKLSYGEIEYSYIHDWRGNRVVEGPLVHRHFVEDQGVISFDIRYFRESVDSHWICSCVMSQYRLPLHVREGRTCPLSADELKLFYAARDAELQRLAALGTHCVDQREGEPTFDILQRE